MTDHPRQPPVVDPATAIEAARTLPTRARGRAVIGLCGEPGAGKSTLATLLAREAGAVVVPMDGFHLAQVELERLGRAGRKGAPDTFDAYGFVALVRRIVAATDPVSYAPAFHRDIEDSIARQIPVAADDPLVVIEGNYLLLDTKPWSQLADLFTRTWYVEVDERLRLERLVARHEAFGKSHGAAVAWANGPDEANARLIRRCRTRADLVVHP